MPLADIQTIVVAILENRSFDHVMGYLSLPNPGGPAPLPVEGLRDDPAWSDPLANLLNGRPVTIHRLGPAIQQIDDPAHDHNSIRVQIDTPPLGGAPHQMGGFVQSYVQFATKPPADPKLVMGFYDAASVPIFDFFARNFAICDHWFAALPTGTQANRLMAMAGESALVDNARVFLSEQQLVYDWLTKHGVRWCAYQSGGFFPFFSLMPRWLPEITTSLALSAAGGRGRFRRYSRFASEWTDNTSEMPQVIFIEPEYTDGPHADPNDDHPPTGIAKAQVFLSDIYRVLISNPARWQNTMLIVSYDEHGGFFDHVPPLPIPTVAGGFPFQTTGVRVPGFVVSPHVAPARVFSGALDHTSILQLLADRFTPGLDFSPAVAVRQASLSRLTDILAPAPIPRQPSPAVADVVSVSASAASSVPSPSSGAKLGDPPNAQAFHNIAVSIARDHPDLLAGPGWEGLAAYIQTPAIP